MFVENARRGCDCVFEMRISGCANGKAKACKGFWKILWRLCVCSSMAMVCNEFCTSSGRGGPGLVRLHDKGAPHGAAEQHRAGLRWEGRPDGFALEAEDYFFSVTMRFVSTTSNVSPVFTRPRTSVSSAGIDQALTTFSAATSISTRTLWFFETAKRLPFS